MLFSSSRVRQFKILLTNHTSPDWKWGLSAEGKIQDATAISVVFCLTCIKFKDTVCVGMVSED